MNKLKMKRLFLFDGPYYVLLKWIARIVRRPMMVGLYDHPPAAGRTYDACSVTQGSTSVIVFIFAFFDRSYRDNPAIKWAPLSDPSGNVAAPFASPPRSARGLDA